MPETRYVMWFADVRATDVAVVGGKNASLGEMIQGLHGSGVTVPDGFAVTAQAYRDFLDASRLRPRIAAELDRLPAGAPLHEVGARIRDLIGAAPLPESIGAAILTAYRKLGEPGLADPDVAVRSSATAEDLPEASFAGQQESFLNVSGEAALLDACRRCFASLFTDRAISYRQHIGFDHMKVALSVGVQRMVRSDLGSSGVIFTIDTETGFPRTVLVTASWGLGEPVVQGQVEPDEYTVFKPLLGTPHLRPVVSRARGAKEGKLVYQPTGGTRWVDTSPKERESLVLSDDEVLTLAEWAVAIENHYGTAMDIEWAKDGGSGELYVVQARPETVQARREAATLRSYRLRDRGSRLVSGLAIGDAITAGRVCLLRSPAEIARFVEGSVLVTGVTDPDWEPVMKRAAAIVTDHGGRTSHAAIVSRELGVPAIVGTGHATTTLADGDEVTVSCAEGDHGFVYQGLLRYETSEVDLAAVPATRTRVMLNLANPSAAYRWWRLPADGVGLLRLEFLIATHVRIHPMALVHPELVDPPAALRIAELTRGWRDPADFFVDRLADGVARIAASRWPDPVVVRVSDFKTNEYARLIGGAGFEPDEENPMLGWRGASRYYDPGYRDGFALECRALRRVRDEVGLTNVIVMVPFCRTPEEADRVLAVMAEQGLVRGGNGLRVYVMAEIPSNILQAAEFARRFDGFSIGSNDLTQLTLGVDRDSERLAGLFDERSPAVVGSIRSLIGTAHQAGRSVGLCGQRPSDDPEFARLLVAAGIDSISVTPDSFLTVKRNVSEAESALASHPAVQAVTG